MRQPTMATDLDALRQIGATLRAQEASPWQPSIVAHAFLAHPVMAGPWALPPLTFRQYIALDAARSPVLSGAWGHPPDPSDPTDPSHPSDSTLLLDQLAQALSILTSQPVTVDDVCTAVTPQTIGDVFAGLARLVREAMATALPMRHPIAHTTDSGAARDPGIGWWLLVLAALVAECHLTPAAALDLPIHQGFALLAATAARQGAHPAGETYREQEALDITSAGPGADPRSNNPPPPASQPKKRTPSPRVRRKATPRTPAPTPPPAPGNPGASAPHPAAIQEAP